MCDLNRSISFTSYTEGIQCTGLSNTQVWFKPLLSSQRANAFIKAVKVF